MVQFHPAMVGMQSAWCRSVNICDCADGRTGTAVLVPSMSRRAFEIMIDSLSLRIPL